MKKKECPACAMMHDINARTCPVCGFEYPQTKWAYQVIAIILVIIFLLFYIL